MKNSLLDGSVKVGGLFICVVFNICAKEISGIGSDHPNSLLSDYARKHERSYYLHRNWPSGIVIFEMSPDFNVTERQKILDAMDEISSKSCVRFQESRRPNPHHYLYIDRRDGDGCVTQTNTRVGRQDMSLDPSWCLEHGRIIHELLHALGFSHEHQRPDRDDFIIIKWKNILEEQKGQFYKDDYPMEFTLGFHYDLTSVMHYANWSNHAAIDPKKPIILPKVYEPNMGQRKGLDRLDAKKINWLYNC